MPHMSHSQNSLQGHFLIGSLYRVLMKALILLGFSDGVLTMAHRKSIKIHLSGATSASRPGSVRVHVSSVMGAMVKTPCKGMM